jgi:lysophospholipase L1-like esterase
MGPGGLGRLRRSRRRLAWWVYGSLVMNGLTLLTLAWWGLRGDRLGLEMTAAVQAADGPSRGATGPGAIARSAPPRPLSYEDWVATRRQEAKGLAQGAAPQAADGLPLGVLLGDSLTSAFPAARLPQRWRWLNQAISGETTAGVLRRVPDLAGLEPEVIFLAIGINDVLRGIDDRRVLDNHRAIAQRVRRQHPRSRLVVQSLLPHRGELAIWEGRDRLNRAPAARLRALNEQLRQLAIAQGAQYLDLYDLFVDEQGRLDERLTTDGLHLSLAGYDVWRGAIAAFVQGIDQTDGQARNPDIALGFTGSTGSTGQ